MNNPSNLLKPVFWAVLLLFVGIVPMGCGSSHRAAVEGTFKLDDKPVSAGTVTFVPEDFKEGGVEHPSATTEIKDGKYSFTSSNGPLPGKYRVYASVKQKTGRQIQTDEPPGKKDEEIELMANFNSENHTAEVKASGDKFDFAAKSGGSVGVGGGGGDPDKQPGRPRNRD